jgi:fructokinase
MQETATTSIARHEAWVAGEVLIDRIPDGRGGRVQVVGGGSANTAKALARLGVRTCFIDGISTDDLGIAARAELEASGVDLGRSRCSEKPTAIAEVTLDAAGNARYVFRLDGTATFDFAESWLPHGAPAVLHVGTLATIVAPGFHALERWAAGLDVPVVYDPNVRPSVLGDRGRYREIVARWVAISDVVKLSVDDLRWLHPECHDVSGDIGVARAMLAQGPSLVVITRGEAGLVGISSDRVIEVPAVATAVVDTVGAGDTAGAVLLEAIVAHGLAGLCSDRLEETLRRAALAAALTCTRAGAQPPWADELRSATVSLPHPA